MKHFHRWGICFAVLISLLSTLRATETAKTRPPAPGKPTVTIPNDEPANTAPVVVWGRTLVHYRLGMEFPDIHVRARAAEERINRALGSIDPDKLIVQPMQIGETRGFAVLADKTFLLKVMEGDLDPEANIPLGTIADNVMAELRTLIRDHAAQHSVSLLIRAGIHSVIATVLFAAFWMLAVWMKSRLLLRITLRAEETGPIFNFFGYDLRPVLLGIAATTIRLLILSVVLCGAYGWITFVLGRFPYTRHWGDQLGGYLLTTVSNLASGAVSQIPDLVALVVIYLVTRGLIRILHGWFFAIESGKHLTTWLDAEAARATRRLVDIGRVGGGVDSGVPLPTRISL